MTTRIYSKMTVLLATFSLAAIALAEIPDPPDPVESEIAAAQDRAQWVRRVQQASDLLGGGKPAEALAAFESLQRDQPAQDGDGMVALAIGDCQFQLKQYERAYATYEQAAQAHPDLDDIVWRLVETELSLGRFDQATNRLQQVVAGNAPPAQKAWATLRLGNVQETQAIQLLGKAEQTYRQATGIFDKLPEPQTFGKRWGKTHAEDLRDTATQLQVAMRQMMGANEMMPVFWPGPSQTTSLPAAEVGKVKISGHVSKSDTDKDTGARPAKEKDAKETVELSVDKDGKVEVTVAGKKVDVDTTTQQQILKHLQYTLRVAGQAGKDPAESKPSRSSD